MPIGIIRSIPETREMLNETMREVVHVSNTRGIDLNENTIHKTWQFYDSIPEESTASMQRDLMDGKPSELDSQTGVIIRYGMESNIQTPLNTFIYHSLLASERVARGDELLTI